MKTSSLSVTLLSALLITAATARVDIAPAGSHHAALHAETKLMCKACNVFITVFEKLMRTKEVETFLDHYLESHMCTRLPEAEQDQCVAEIPKAVAGLIEFIEHIASSQLCINFHVCEPSDVQEIRLREELEYTAFAKKADSCKMCKKFARKVDKKLDSINDDTIDGYKNMLKKECTKLPKPVQEKCESLVIQYSSALLYFLEKEHRQGNIVKACSDLHICESATPISRLPPFQPALVKKMKDAWVKSEQSDKCTSCKETVAKSTGSIRSDDFRKEVSDYVESICRHVPPIKNTCNSHLKEFADEFLYHLSQTLEPEALCEKFGFCGHGAVTDDKIQSALDICPYTGQIMYAT